MKMGNNKKADQLGMPIGTASGRLKKSIIFHLIKKMGENFCYQCGSEIEKEEELSIEHKIPWLNSENPVELFFGMNNISFSHHSCNVGAARPKQVQHPSRRAYQNGCRCDGCKAENAAAKVKWRANKKARAV